MKLLAKPPVRYGLTGLLLALVLAKVEPQRLATSLRTVDGLDLLIALALTVPFLACKSLRWYLMLREAGVRAGGLEATMSLIGGMGLALITPARLGELVRAAYLRDPQKLKIGGLVMIDKGFDVLVLCALSVAGAWRLVGPLAGLALAAVAVVGLAAVYMPRRVEGRLAAVGQHLPFNAGLSRVLSSAESLNPRSTSVFLALTAASFAVVMLQYGVILLSWRPWSLDIVLLTFPLVILTNVLPITIGGLGVREGAAAALLAHYGVPAADAAITALVSSAFNTYLPGIGGALLFPLASRERSRTQARAADQT